MMAWPNVKLDATYRAIEDAMAGIKRLAQDVRTEATGNLPAPRIITLYTSLNEWKATINAAAAVAGIVTYIRDQKNDQALNVAGEAGTVVTAIDGVLGWVSANFPRDADGYMLYQKFSGNTTVDRTFAPATTATLRTLLDTLIGTIN
jgi:hypothetical protein